MNIKIKKIHINFGKFVIFICVVAYIIMFINTFWFQKMDTVILKEGKIEDVDTTDAIITRNEKVVNVDQNSGEMYRYALPGERVSRGQAVVALNINKKEPIISQPKTDKQDKLPVLFNSDIQTIDKEVEDILTDISKNDYYEEFEKNMSYKETLNNKLQKKTSIISVLTNGGSLEDDSKDVKSNTGDMFISPMAGTVIYNLDGYEDVLTVENISTYTKESLTKLDVPKGELVGSLKEESFKVVDNIEAYLTVILDSKYAQNASIDQKVTIRLNEVVTGFCMTGRIDYITFDKDGNAVITFKINRGIEELMNYRNVKIDVIWSSKEGYKVPCSTIAKSDAENKIYVVKGRNYVDEKKIKIKKEKDGYAIIEPAEDTKLYLYDSVIENISKVNLDKILQTDKKIGI